MEAITIILYTIVVVIALLLIGLILVQQSKSSGFGSAFGGAGEAVFGARASTHMTKLTVVLTFLFFVFTLLLAVIIGNRDKSKDGVIKQPVAAAVEAAEKGEAAKKVDTKEVEGLSSSAAADVKKDSPAEEAPLKK